MRGYGIKAVAVAAAALCVGLGARVVRAEDDSYIRGYVAAIAGRDYHVRPGDVEVHGGVVSIDAAGLTGEERVRLERSVREIPGVTDVRVSEPGVAATPAEQRTSAAVVSGSTATEVVPAERDTSERVTREARYFPADDDTYKLGLLPGRTLFDPLLADPRWPHFAGTLRVYQNDKRFGNDIGSAQFGGSLAVYRFGVPGTERAVSELGFQVGVFSMYDMDSDSHDLVNADYFAALTDTVRVGRFSLIGRVLHQSSHLGDEYLLKHEHDPGFKRINASFEQVNAIASYDLTRSLRVYGGAGWLFDQDPQSMEQWSFQYGAEYKAGWTIGDHMRPVAAVDFQQREREDWNVSLSARAGVQFEGAALHGNRLLLLLEYYAGHDPNGQFYTESVQWWGLGLHWFF